MCKNVFTVKNNEHNRKALTTVPHWEISDKYLAVDSKAYQKSQKKLGAVVINKLRSLSIDGLLYYGYIYLALIILRFLFTYAQTYLIMYFSQYAMYDLRRDLFRHLLKMPLKYFDTNPIGRLVTRVTNDIKAIDEMISSGLITIVQDVLTLFGIIAMMLVLNWKLALVSFTILPIVVVITFYFRFKTRITYRNMRSRLAEVNATISEDISGMKIIQLFNQMENKKEKFQGINYNYFKATWDQMTLFAMFQPLINISRYVTTALILWYGGGQILQSAMTIGVFLAFLRYLERFFEPINSLADKFNILQGAFAGAERVFDLLNEKPENYRQDAFADKRFKGEIEFKNLWLAYNENEWVLKDVSFKVKPGEKIALVGHTGSGKTSIVNLILNMYQYQKGEILIDGISVKELALDDIRKNVGMVQQDVFLFTGTVKDNIVLANDSFTEEKLREVARFVHVDKFIESLPQKYLEPVMERGATFSVGQRQLIAFARVLAYDPSIFILDEATSNIDTETEMLIQDALERLMENRTSMIIAHRLSTIQHVDRIIVLHKGEIVEEGSHQELLSKNGLYYDLYRLQYQSQLKHRGGEVAQA